MRCPGCGFENLATAVYCGGCGRAIGERPARPYTPAHLSAQLLASPAAVEGERKQVTVLFCDLVESTGLAERIGAEAMHGLLEEFFAIALAHVHRYEGTINQFLGDGFMALFGAPVAHEDHARRAALAALDIREGVAAHRFERAGSARDGLTIRMGLNSGAVVVGRLGDHLRMDYTAVGDTTNLASRMLSLAAPGTIYATEATRRLIDLYVDSVDTGEQYVKGKRDATRAYRLVDRRAAAEPDMRAFGPLGAPLVGRDAEVACLTGSIDRLRTGEGAIVSVIGEAGLGKSRLLAEVSAASRGDVRWLEGRALSFGLNLSYWPFLEILRSAAGIADSDSDDEAAPKLERLVDRLFPESSADILPYVATLLSLPVSEPLRHRVSYLDGHATGLQVFRSVLLLFERLARERPLVVVFEDIHWADRSSLELLEHIVPLVVAVPLLIVIVGRAESTHPAAHLRARARALVKDHHIEIILAPLHDSASAALLEHLLPGSWTSARLKQDSIRRAGGNPFFLEEIVRNAVADGLLQWNAATGKWQVTRETEHIRLPDTLHDVIAARIDRLDADTKQVLIVAAVIGRSFHYRVLQVAASAGDRLDGALEQLESLELIREKRRTPEVEYFFKHALVQEATYGTLLGARQRELHRRVGDAIESLFADRLEDFYGVLAYHYAKAEAWPQAQAFLLKAGDQAGRLAADAEALAHYQDAMAAYERVFGDQWDPLQRSTLERKIGEALFRQGHHEQALAIVIGAKARLHRPLTALPGTMWGTRAAIAGEVVRRVVRSLIARVWARREAAPVDPKILDEISRLGEITGWIDYFLNPERLLLQALTGLAYFERHPHAIGLIYNHMSIGLICDVVPAFALAERHHREALSIAAATGQPIALGHAHLGMGMHAHASGQLRQALDGYERSAAIFQEIGHIRGWGGATMLRSWVYEDRGDFEQALSHAESVSEIGEKSSDPQIRAWGLLRRGIGRRALDRTDAAIADIDASIALSQEIPDYAGIVQGLGVLALCHLDRGDRPRARQLVDEATDLRRTRKLRGMWIGYAIRAAAEVALAELDLSDQSPRARRATAARACRDARSLGRMARQWLPVALRLQGNLNSREGRMMAAKRQWQGSADVAEEVGALHELRLARAALAQAERH